MKNIVLLLSLVVLFAGHAHASTSEISSGYHKVYCDKLSYLEIEAETFKQNTKITCEKISSSAEEPIFQINIFEQDTPVNFTRKDIKLHIPLGNYQNNDSANKSMFVYDEKIDNWVIMSSEIKSNEYVGKIFRTGKIKIAQKLFSTNQFDNYSKISLIILIFGIIILLFYNKNMYKKLFIFIFFCLIFTGCASNKDIQQYNKLSVDHQTVTLEAFDNLSNALKSYNEKKYDDAINYSDKCKTSYEQAKKLSQDGKEVATSAKLSSWIFEFKDISIQSEDIRIKQCELIKSVSTEAKKLNPDTEILTSIVNEIADFNAQFDKLQTTLNDMQQQHSSNFE